MPLSILNSEHRPPLTDPDADAVELLEWQAWVGRFAALLNAPVKAIPVPPQQTSRQCLIFAPHPDDECIVGALPLRLRQEAGWSITNVAVTLGSKCERRAERWQELEEACALLGFANIRLAEQGFEAVKPQTAETEPALWAAQVQAVAEFLRRTQPALILLPHASDGIPTHIATHALVTEAVAAAQLTCVLAQTEFWASLEQPNWLVETGNLDTARLVQALSRHRGEVQRNPYHLRLPAFLADSVRRGGELIAGAGSVPPDYAFATLYRLSAWREGRPLVDLPARLCPAELGLQGDWLNF